MRRRVSYGVLSLEPGVDRIRQKQYRGRWTGREWRAQRNSQYVASQRAACLIRRGWSDLESRCLISETFQSGVLFLSLFVGGPLQTVERGVFYAQL